ncbi:hypothetical protein AMTRI_Chr06g175980 [Amborella trichopoda]
MRCKSFNIERFTSKMGRSKSLSYSLNRSLQRLQGLPHKKPSSCSFLSSFFSSFGRGKKKEVLVVKEKREKQKKKWPWRPHPDRRWPVQGWR